MKPIKLFYQARCPFCKRAFNYIDELKKRPEYKDIVIETIEETEHPDIADQYDYYYVPTFYIADEKVHEGGIYPNEVEAIFKKALIQELYPIKSYRRYNKLPLMVISIEPYSCTKAFLKIASTSLG